MFIFTHLNTSLNRLLLSIEAVRQIFGRHTIICFIIIKRYSFSGILLRQLNSREERNRIPSVCSKVISQHLVQIAVTVERINKRTKNCQDTVVKVYSRTEINSLVYFNVPQYFKIKTLSAETKFHHIDQSSGLADSLRHCLRNNKGEG